MRRIAPIGLLAAAFVLLGVAAPASALSYDDGDATGVELDATAPFPGGPSTPTTSQRVFTVDGGGRVGRVEIGLRFTQAQYSCTPGVDGDGETYGIYFADIQYTLTSPAGTTVTLIAGDDFPGNGTASYPGFVDPLTPGGTAPTPDPVDVLLLDDPAVPLVGSTNDGEPETGSFRPTQPLAAFDGELATGDWILTIADMYPRSPHCYSAATFEVGVIPELPGAALPYGVVGRDYETQIPGIPEGSTLAVVDEAAVPAGLAVDAQGVVTGVPEQTGSYAFEATATDEEGTSDPATFTIDVLALPAIDGPATAEATIGEAFSYAPTFYRGVPEADAVATGLPAGLEVDAATAAITGIPEGPAGEYVVDYVADNGLEPAATHQVTITIAEANVPPTTAPPTTDPPTTAPPTTPVPSAPAPTPAPTDPPIGSSLPPTGAVVGWGLVAAAAAAVGAGAALRSRRRRR
ncbi:putative Ig domain-containing protein [Agrococcus jejuensis]|nr:putative Ig domain-containing protein [Agrococcus jejuensis]